MDVTCSAPTKNGAPCRGQVWRDGLCRFHHPDLENALATGRARGGTARSTAVRARRQFETLTLESGDLGGVLGSTLVRVLNGELPPNVGNSVATIARAVLQVREVTELEERIAALEAEAETRRKGGVA